MAGTKTALFSRKTPGGVFSIEDQSTTTGDRWFADSNNGATTNSGTSPDDAMTTITAAKGKATANQGDIVYIMPGHVETVATAAALDFDKAGVKYIGLGWGDTRPKVQLSASASTVEFNADDMWIENLIFEGTFTGGVVVGLDIKTGCDDLMIKGCAIRGTSTTKELLQGVTIEATNDRITFEGCDFYEYAGDATVAIITEGAFTNLRLIRCNFTGTWATAILDLDAAASTAQGLYAEDCTFVSHGASDGLMITLDNTTVAQFLRCNTFGRESNQLPLAAADDGGTTAIESYGTDAYGTNGILWPSTATAWS